MKAMNVSNAGSAALARPVQSVAVMDGRLPLITRFGDAIDVRNRGTLKVGRFAGSHAATEDAPAVVRIWTDEQCRELSAHQARALAAQLLAAALLAESQNNAWDDEHAGFVDRYGKQAEEGTALRVS